MNRFAPGDRVHVARLGTGTIREVRNGDRYLVEIKARTLVVGVEQIESAAPERRRRAGGEAAALDATVPAATPARTFSVDLHGRTSAEALEALDAFLNDALLAGAADARVVHGRSGGVVRAAVHTRLSQLPSVRSFRIDPRNAGVTIVTF